MMNTNKLLILKSLTSWPNGWLAVIFLAMYLCNTSLHAQFNPLHIRAVEANATGNNDGTSWANAYNFLQDALAFASVPQNGITEIWVATGIYVPDNDSDHPGGTNDREATFLLDFNNIILLGGFIGTEADRNDRNPELNFTVLSGLFSSSTESVCADAGAGSCTDAHDTPGCDDEDCCSTICSIFPSCCQIVWDEACASLASLVCGICGEPGSGDCFSANGTPGCEYALCCSLVCEIDQFCCENQWDKACAGIAEFTCTPDVDPRAYHVVTADGVDESVRIDGFTITQGLANGAGFFNGIGAGMFINDASPAVVRVTFKENAAPGHGGAMHIQGDSDLMVVNTTFVQNTGFEAGAIHTKSGSAGITYVNCLFISNTSLVRGGAINTGGSGFLKFINCTFSDNSVASKTGAGAINWEGSTVILTNCILWGNLAAGKPSQIVGDATVTYSNVQGGWGDPTDMNIDENPLFINAAKGNYRLQLGSPCFNVGDPDENVIPLDTFDVDQDKDETERTPDLDRLKRIANGIVDMGAYESEYCTWDLDGNGSVGVGDLLALFAQWGTAGSADFNNDGIVNTADLLILFANWGPCE